MGQGLSEPLAGPLLSRVIGAFAKYVKLPDYSVIEFVCGVGVTAEMDGDPMWGLLVAPPSTAKTEAVRVLGDVADEALDEVTPAGLLSWSRGKSPKQVGVLADHPGRCFATIGDLSTILAASDRGRRDELFALLRRAHDGAVTRAHNQGMLEWRGRLTLLAAATPTVDRYSSHADALGPRWVYFRLPDLSDRERLDASRAARANSRGIEAHRHLARAEASRAVAEAVKRLDVARLSPELEGKIDDATQVACLGRAAIERSGYGRQEIISQPIVEGPGRLAIQLAHLARALDALQLAEPEVARIVQKVALDSMPSARQAVLKVLAAGELIATAELARRAGLNRGVARRALEELKEVGLTTYDGADRDDGEEDQQARKPWMLDGPSAKRVVALVQSQRCPEMGGNHPTPPTQSHAAIPHSSGHASSGDES